MWFADVSVQPSNDASSANIKVMRIYGRKKTFVPPQGIKEENSTIGRLGGSEWKLPQWPLMISRKSHETVQDWRSRIEAR